MLSIELIRQKPDSVRQALAKRGEEASFEPLLELDKQRRSLVRQRDELRARQNEVSRQIGRSKEKPQPLIEEMRGIADHINQLDGQVKSLEAKIEEALLLLPNLPRDDVPVGRSAEDNRVIRTWGQPPSFNFVPHPHWELGEKLDILDIQRGVKLSGSRFYVLKGAGATLERALINFMLDVHVKEHGYTEVLPPMLVKKEVMVGSGNLPRFADNLYHDSEDDLWLIPTGEVPLTNLYRDEILSPGSLPIYHVASTPCFRREKAAAGKDTRGIKRVHQFNKVEMYKFVVPETSDDELEKLLADAEDICRRLGLHYRVLQLCTADLGFQSAKSYDIEIWAAGSKEWLEVSSCSSCTDFQARRANIRFRRKEGARPEYVHTLNGSGLALPRLMIALLENNQREDGSVVIPEVLRPYTGFAEIKLPR